MKTLVKHLAPAEAQVAFEKVGGTVVVSLWVKVSSMKQHGKPYE